MRSLLGAAGFEQVLELALGAMLADIRADLAEFGVEFDHWYSSASSRAAVPSSMRWPNWRRAVRCTTRTGQLVVSARQYGDDEDRVLVRANGQRTYFAPDIAYHLQKRERALRG